MSVICDGSNRFLDGSSVGYVELDHRHAVPQLGSDLAATLGVAVQHDHAPTSRMHPADDCLAET